TPQVYGYYAAANKRPAYDVNKAKALLKEAGYPNGFEVTLDCPNDRYINDALICQALTSMWAKIGLKVNLDAMPKAQYFAKINKRDTSLYMLGWAVATFDAHDALMLHTTDIAHLMLHQQIIPSAMRKNINVTHSADNRLRMWWVHVNDNANGKQ